MNIRDMQQYIEESLGSLHETVLPPEIGGLRLLPVAGFRPKVNIYHADEVSVGSKRRKVLESADVTTFDPSTCEIVITFEPIKDLNSNLSEKPKRVRAKFNPIRIKGGMISDTVIQERKESRY